MEFFCFLLSVEEFLEEAAFILVWKQTLKEFFPILEVLLEKVTLDQLPLKAKNSSS